MITRIGHNKTTIGTHKMIERVLHIYLKKIYGSVGLTHTLDAETPQLYTVVSWSLVIKWSMKRSLMLDFESIIHNFHYNMLILRIGVII